MKTRTTIPLDGMWHMATDSDDRGKQESWFTSEPPPEAVLGAVPAALEMTFPNYDGVVWYWREFELQELNNQKISLRIGAAEYFCEAWVNGQPVGQHEGGNAPAIFDITNAIQPGSNRLTIRLINPSDTPIDGFERRFIPHSNRICNWRGSDNRWHNWGGIWQSVEIVIVPVVYIADIFAQPHWRDGSVTAHIQIKNSTEKQVKGELTVSVAPEESGHIVNEETIEVTLKPGITEQKVSLKILNAREWSPDNPYLYRMQAQWKEGGLGDELSVRFGLREFTIADGYFRLNGRRFFPRGALQAGHYPAGICRPLDPALLYRELLCVKQAGFNMMRALGYTPIPAQLDMADQLGILIYQETPASWRLEKSPQRSERWKANVREMILRDRNHPSVVMWGLLNESVAWDKDGEILEYAANYLPELRSLDPSRMIALDSGCIILTLNLIRKIRPDIGEFSLPETRQWTKEVADVHFYFNWPMADEDIPMSRESQRTYRKPDMDGRKVFYSEFGFGSPMDPLIALRKFEEWGISEDNDDYRFFKGMADGFLEDWKELKMTEVFPAPSHLVRAGMEIHARKVTDLWRYVQASPTQIGTIYTGMADESGNSPGVFTYWRDIKPAVEAIRKAQKPLSWSLFVNRPNMYQGDKLQIEAVLRNEDVLSPGTYPVRLLLDGPRGIVWKKDFKVIIPPFENGKKETKQVVFPVCNESIIADFSQGNYEAHILLLQGGDAWASEKFYIADPASLPKVSATVMELGLPQGAKDWLEKHGIRVLPFNQKAKDIPLLVHDIISLSDAEKQLSLALEFAASGGTMVCLEIVGANHAIGASGVIDDLVEKPSIPQYHQKLELLLRMLPGAHKAQISWDSRNWFISTEHYVRCHPVFDGLPTRCLLADGTYEIIYPLHTILALEEWNEINGAFCLGALGGKWGYWHSTDLATIEHGSGRIILSTYRLLGPLSYDPTAGQMLLNLIRWLL
jgi:hypothetical protein